LTIFQPLIIFVKISQIMGKGDIKSKKGKIWNGSYGKKLPAKTAIKATSKK